MFSLLAVRLRPGVNALARVTDIMTNWQTEMSLAKWL